MSYRPSNLLLWFGVGGGAVAFAVQFVAGLAFSFAQCNGPGAGPPQRAWQVGLASGAFVVGLAAAAVAATIFRRTYRIGDVFAEERRGDGSAPPLGRIHFLSIVGLTVNFLVLIIIVLDAVGTGLHTCMQT
jgi:hypothetical protein